MQAGSEGFLGYNLPKASHTRHLSGFNHEVRVKSEDGDNDHNDEANA
jgi:hypothetical protein